MVRRLVEQQQVGRRSSSRQSATRRRSPPDRDVTSRVAVGQPQRVHRDGRAARRAPRRRARSIWSWTRRLLGEQRVEVGVRLGELRRDRVEPVEQVAQLAARRPRRSRGRSSRRRGRGSCSRKPDGRIRRELGDARRGLLLARHDPEQRRLAGAVRAEHADLRAGQERERDVREDLPVGTVELVGPVHGEDVVAAHGGHDTRG